MDNDIMLDWPNLGKYQKDNGVLLQSESDERRVVFMGDSITEEWSNLYPSYFKERSYVNRGIGGQTTPQMLIRFKQDVIDLSPYLVLILAGTNDIAGNTGNATIKMITDNIFSMSELASLQDINVILCSILPVKKYDWARQIKDPPTIITSVNSQLKAYATKRGITYLDYYSKMVDGKQGLKDKYTYDGVHPNQEGYVLMSELVEDAISEILSL